MKSAPVVSEVPATSTSHPKPVAEPTRTTSGSFPAVVRPFGAPSAEPARPSGSTPAVLARPFGTLNAETTRAFTVATQELRPAARPESGHKAQRVLLVDDSRSIRTLLKIYLMARAFEYIEAESAEIGLRELATQPVDLILTDFHMDGMNGADFAALVRAHADAKVARTPILMMTGDANAAEVRNKGQKAGINAFVRKPVSCAHLMTLVDTILPAAK